MFPFVARMALVLLVSRALAQLAQHPRFAPLAKSRKGRLAFVLLGWGLHSHPRTRTAGRVMRAAARHVRAA